MTAENTLIKAIIEREVTASTNKDARLYIADAKEPVPTPALFIAREQTEGRGRLGRSFYSPASSGLYASLLFKAPSDVPRLLRLTSLAAVAALCEIKQRFGIELDIKWVNDLYLGQKKVAGILAESFSHDGTLYIVLGIGINLSTELFPDELMLKAGSLGLCEMSDAERCELALGIFCRLLDYLSRESVADIMELYRSRSCVIGKKISFWQGERQIFATALDVTDAGALLVRIEDTGEQTILSSGEISIFLQDLTNK